MTNPPFAQAIPSFALYGEQTVFPDMLHVEEILDRAAHLNWTIAPHRHVLLHQMVYLRAGTAEVTIEGHRHILTAGQVVNLPSGCVHSFAFSPAAIGTVVTFPLPEWPEYFGPNADCAAALSAPFLANVRADFASQIDALTAAHRSTAGFRGLHLRAASAALILAALYCGARAQSRAEDPRIGQLRALIDARPNIAVTVAECAKTLGLSPRQLARLCQTATGQNVQALLHSAILREACRNLAYTRLHIASIAHQLGFEEPSYFSRFFTRLMGVSPSAYRARMNG